MIRLSNKDEHPPCQSCKVQTYIPCPLAWEAHEKDLDLVSCAGLKEFGEKLIDAVWEKKSRRRN